MYHNGMPINMTNIFSFFLQICVGVIFVMVFAHILRSFFYFFGVIENISRSKITEYANQQSINKKIFYICEDIMTKFIATHIHNIDKTFIGIFMGI